MSGVFLRIVEKEKIMWPLTKAQKGNLQKKQDQEKAEHYKNFFKRVELAETTAELQSLWHEYFETIDSSRIAPPKQHLFVDRAIKLINECNPPPSFLLVHLSFKSQMPSKIFPFPGEWYGKLKLLAEVLVGLPYHEDNFDLINFVNRYVSNEKLSQLLFEASSEQLTQLNDQKSRYEFMRANSSQAVRRIALAEYLQRVTNPVDALDLVHDMLENWS